MLFVNLDFFGVKDRKGQAAGNGDRAAHYLGNGEGFSLGEEVQCNEYDHSLEGVAHSGGDGSCRVAMYGMYVYTVSNCNNL